MSLPAQVATPQKQKAVAFTRLEQILKILSEVSRLKIEVLVRYSSTGKAVRGIAEHLSLKEKSFLVSGISPAGDDLLKGHDKVRVEFVLLSTKLVFDTVVRARVPGKIVLSIPTQLISIERRRNSRFKVPSNQAAFVEFADEHAEMSRFDAPFVPPFLCDEALLVPRLRVDDVSLGGLACFTRYSAVSSLLKPSEVGVMGKIFFPDLPPMLVPVSIRWIKKTLNAVPAGRYPNLTLTLSSRTKSVNVAPDLNLKETYFRVGLQFAEVSQELDAALRKFIHSVQTAESV